MLLESLDKTAALSALTFLGGRHIDELQLRSFPETHESKYAVLFQELLGSTRIREIIHHLCSSDNEWIREAATAGLPSDPCSNSKISIFLYNSIRVSPTDRGNVASVDKQVKAPDMADF
jgi:hypothetical protein